ncbi:Alpha-ketoglutarate-dependent dioxygenase alkB 7, mitochondrial [Gaertneriomyces sp. JEL0708]|nr:Alpha-ketoglutarate-dependent dioxygenase alkB 7, mitochondrial [Gaertneriomyces sp. JEL0708]
MAILRHLRTARYRSLWPRFRHIDGLRTVSTSTQYKLDPSNPYLDLTNHSAPLPPSDALILIPNFLSESEHSHLISECDRKIKRLCGRKYLDGHFDQVISTYRECSVSAWNGSNATQQGLSPGEAEAVAILDRVKRTVQELLDAKPIRWLDPHILDLGNGGEIRAHVDNLEASGSIIVGLSLLSPAVIVFRKSGDPSQYFRALVEARSLYIQSDELRYGYTHEIPNEPQLLLNNKQIIKDRRISIMLRDVK